MPAPRSLSSWRPEPVVVAVACLLVAVAAATAVVLSRDSTPRADVLAEVGAGPTPVATEEETVGASASASATATRSPTASPTPTAKESATVSASPSRARSTATRAIPPAPGPVATTARPAAPRPPASRTPSAAPTTQPLTGDQAEVTVTNDSSLPVMFGVNDVPPVRIEVGKRRSIVFSVTGDDNDGYSLATDAKCGEGDAGGFGLQAGGRYALTVETVEDGCFPDGEGGPPADSVSLKGDTYPWPRRTG